jgi:hypothetical protein
MNQGSLNIALECFPIACLFVCIWYAYVIASVVHRLSQMNTAHGAVLSTGSARYATVINPFVRYGGSAPTWLRRSPEWLRVGLTELWALSRRVTTPTLTAACVLLASLAVPELTTRRASSALLVLCIVVGSALLSLQTQSYWLRSNRDRPTLVSIIGASIIFLTGVALL